MSPIRHRTPLPHPGLPRFQNQSILRYTLSASGLPSNRRNVIAAQQLSLIRSPDAPISVRNRGRAQCAAVGELPARDAPAPPLAQVFQSTVIWRWVQNEFSLGGGLLAGAGR